MGQNKGCEQETLIKELTQGKELTEKLMKQLDPLASPNESCDFLIQKIISSYDKAISMLNWGDSEGESPQSLEEYDQNLNNQCHKDIYKKRKTMPRWTEQVRVCLGTGQRALDDGYSWRKYGQKDILGANFPRAYYRCTHRHVQGCLATKQVQRSDEDPSVFEITYRGRHTCIQTSQVAPPALASIGKSSPKQDKDPYQPHLEEGIHSQSQEMLFDYEKGLRVKTEDLGITVEVFPSSSFSFPSTPIESQNVETNIFPENLKEKDFLGSDSLAFVFQETSESNFFSLLPSQMDNFGFCQNLQHSESDLSEIISAPSSVTNSPIGNMDFPLDQLDFDPNFPFDTCEFFS